MKAMTLFTKTKKAKNTGMEYISYALSAFGALGMEIIYAYAIEPFFYGNEMGNWTVWQTMLHWTITCITWLILALLICKDAKKKLSFSILDKKPAMKIWQYIICISGVALSIYCNYIERNEFKFLREYRILGNVQIVGQYVYYMCETVLFLLIIVFAQEAMERWIKSKYQIPYGGIVCGVTWGLAHIFTKTSIVVGLQSVILATIMGSIYLLTNKDVKKAYIFLFLMFSF